MLLVVPEVPGVSAIKPVVQGFGCRLGRDTISCEALVVSASIPAQTLTAHLLERGRSPVVLLLDWSDVPASAEAYQHAEIDLHKETT